MCLVDYLPVLVEATSAFFRQMLGPNVDEGTVSEWSFNVTYGTDNNHWWRFQNGNGLNNLLLVDLYKKKTKLSIWSRDTKTRSISSVSNYNQSALVAINLHGFSVKP